MDHLYQTADRYQCQSSTGQAYLQSVLQTLHENNLRTVRLDAIGYAVKKQAAVVS
jgi:hypothetical protein